MKTLTIGQLASESGVNVETVRYYERRGLIPQPPRSEAGYRQYPENVVGQIRFVKRAQGIGFSLSGVSELLALQAAPGTSSAEIRERAEAKLRDVEERSRDLETMRVALTELLAKCDGQGSVAECSILAAIAIHEGGRAV